LIDIQGMSDETTAALSDVLIRHKSANPLSDALSVVVTMSRNISLAILARTEEAYLEHNRTRCLVLLAELSAEVAAWPQITTVEPGVKDS
jgi:hypothetical protein